MTDAKSQTIDFQNRCAILVGVGAYPESSGIPTLEHPSDDVQKLRDVLITRGAFEPSNIKSLTNAQATGEGLKTAFEDFRSNVKANDLFLFYFSGHGARVKSGFYVDEERDGLNECLLLYDSIRRTEQNYLRDSELGQLLGSLKAKRIIIIDACYSAGDKHAKAITTDDAAVNQRDGIINDYMPQGTVILEACAPDQKTFDGVFTSRLVKVLQDDTLHGADGIITLEETWKDLQKILRDQSPQLNRIGVSKPIFLIQPLVTISSQPNGAEVFVDDKQLLDENRQPATTPISIILPIGKYQFKLRKWGYRIPPDSFSFKVEEPGKQESMLPKLESASIRGKLVYENSGKPVVGANARLEPLGYGTTTNTQGEFVFNDWEQYKIRPGVKYQVQILDEKERVPFHEEPLELQGEFYEDIPIDTFSLRNLAREQMMMFLRYFGIVMAVLVSIIVVVVWLWKRRKRRYLIWLKEIDTALQTSGEATLDSIPQKYRDDVIARYINENPSRKFLSDEEHISDLVRIYEFCKNEISMELQQSGIALLDSIRQKYRDYVAARYIDEHPNNNLVFDEESIGNPALIYELWKNKISTELREAGSVSLDSIPQKYRDYVQSLYTQEHSDTKLVTGEDYISYQAKIAERIADFHVAWKTALANLPGDTSEQIDTFRKAAKDITDILCRALGFERKDSEDAEADFERLYGHLVNAPTLRLNIPNTFPFIYIQRDTPTDSDLDALIELMRIRKLNVIQRFAFVIVFSNSQRVQERLRDKGLRLSYDFVIFDEDNLRDTLIAEYARDISTKIISSQVELTKIAPYRIAGPVSSNAFFGRGREIKTILRTLQQNNVALLGGRRIGKTSILHRIRDILLKMEGTVEYEIAEEDIQLSLLDLDCEGVSNYETFLRRAASKWRARISSNSLENFYEFASRKQEEYKRRLAIFIDEVDGILKYDLEHDHQLFGMFRALSEEKSCRFVFTGERIVHSAMLNPDSPLFNFCEPFQIGYLDPKSTELLVSDPMKLIEVQLEDEEEIISQIVKLTSCHPRMVQWVCLDLLKKINIEGTRIITIAHLKTVENSGDFQDEFINTIWGQRTALEEFVSLLIIEADAPMSAGEIGDKLKENEINISASDLKTTLDMLQFTSVLTEEDGYYRFLASEFPRIFRANRSVRDFIERLKEDISK